MMRPNRLVCPLSGSRRPVSSLQRTMGFVTISIGSVESEHSRPFHQALDRRRGDVCMAGCLHVCVCVCLHVCVSACPLFLLDS